VIHPEYPRPDQVTLSAVETRNYDAVGNLLSYVDRRDQVTNCTHDNLNRVVRQLDPLITGEAARRSIRPRSAS
jgi:YD repeat-containing protein